MAREAKTVTPFFPGPPLSVYGNIGGAIIQRTGYLRGKKKVTIYRHVLYRKSFSMPGSMPA
jgi:hypothetical protein